MPKFCSSLRRSLLHSHFYRQLTYMIFIYSQSLTMTFLTSSNGNEISRESATNAIQFLLTIHISQSVQTVTHFSIALFRESQNLHTIISELHQTIYFESREVEMYGKVLFCLRLSCGSKQNSVTQYHSVFEALRDWFPAYCD